MRFDDMIATVLAQPWRGERERVARWRQLVDLLAQPRARTDGGRAVEALAFLREHRSGVTVETRREIARSLGGRRIDPLLLAFFASDDAGVAAPLVSTALMEAEEWLHVLPMLSPPARALLRHRRDLDPTVAQALATFGPSDLVLGPSEAQMESAQDAPEPEQGEAQIRSLVARIEAFRKQREASVGAAPSPEHDAEAFRWETGSEGIILWVDGAPRGAIVGQSIASIAERGQYGVDGQAAGAFEKRAPFRDARFRVPGEGAASGDWRISGVPFFDPQRGTFLGFRGSARRPRVDEVARTQEAASGTGLFGTELPADSLRQLIHELRTPLNAIVGFAEMIDGQYMGPAASSYRSRAGEILEQARRLLSAVDDLDTAARIETSRLSLDGGEAASVDAVALLCRLHDAYERVANQRSARIRIEIEQDLPMARVEIGAAERMFARILAATIGLSAEGETISAAMTLQPMGPEKMLCLAIDRPQAIDGIEESALLDPGYSPDGDWPGAPALGLGFALRLVRNLAEAVGGALVIGPERFSLYLPPLHTVERSAGQGGEGMR